VRPTALLVNVSYWQYNRVVTIRFRLRLPCGRGGTAISKLGLLQARGVHGNGKDWDPIPWDSHGNGSKISHGMGMGWEWELSAWEWELRRGSCHQQL